VITNTALRRTLLGLAALNLAVVAWDVTMGGIYFTVFGVTFSSWEIAKPLLYAAGCAATSVWLRDRAAARVSWDALAPWTAGDGAVFLVVPLFAGMAVWFTYVAGARAIDGRVGLLAAILVAFSPLFLLQSFEPMSDVPAVAWWTAAWAMSMSAGPWSAFGAGVAAAAAILTRPNLAPLALAVAASAVLSPPRLRRAAAFAAPVVAGCAIVAAFNDVLYGSPLLSGYGPARTLYAWANLAPNTRAYAR